MRILGSIQIATMLLYTAASYALPPSNAESDAFIKAYSFDVLKALVDENLAFKVESRQLTKAHADCARMKINLNHLLSQARPIVSATFKDSEAVNQATAFFSSPTGTKLKDFGIATLRDFLRAKLRGQQPAASPSVPPTFTEQDIRVATDFNNSPAGQQFVRFVSEGLPQLRRVDQLEPALVSCRAPVSE